MRVCSDVVTETGYFHGLHSPILKIEDYYMFGGYVVQRNITTSKQKWFSTRVLYIYIIFMDKLIIIGCPPWRPACPLA